MHSGKCHLKLLTSRHSLMIFELSSSVWEEGEKVKVYSERLAVRALTQKSSRTSLGSFCNITILRSFRVTGVPDTIDSDGLDEFDEDDPFGIVLNPVDEYGNDIFLSFRRTRGQFALLSWLHHRWRCGYYANILSFGR